MGANLLWPIYKNRREKMKLLALNTAFVCADLAFSDGDRQKFVQVDSNCKHSEVVMNQIDTLLDGTKINQLDAMAVVVGTGSFTGIRISIAIAEGFKTANPNLNLISVNSFELANYCIKNTKGQKYAIVFNALGGRYFVQYFFDGNPQSDFLLLEQKDIENVKKYGLKSENLEFCDDFFQFSAQDLFCIAQTKATQRQYVDVLQPLYIRKSQAEEQLDKKNEN